jgi:small subunit ribosomal protein S6
MILNNYESVFILTPVLSEPQMKDTAEKFVKVLKDNGAEIINEESWGLRKLAYTIQHKNTGYYFFVEFKAPATLINTLETEYRRDEKVLRFLSTKLDKFSLEYNKRRKKGEFKKSTEKQEASK